MTLAIGMQCKDGIVLAADTRVSYQDGSISDITKVQSIYTGNGVYAIAQSSHDANAASSLMAEIRTGLLSENPASFPDIENVIKHVMREWYVPVYENRPTVHLLIGACLGEDILPNALYFCEPPLTVLCILDNYKAIGDGWVVTDPIYKNWFEDSSKSLHESLCRISYLMYKGKQLLPASVGGHTDAVFISPAATLPYSIERLSMDVAESCGPMFDRSMSKLVSLALSGDDGGTSSIMGAAQDIYQTSLNYSRLEFRCLSPEITIRHGS